MLQIEGSTGQEGGIDRGVDNLIGVPVPAPLVSVDMPEGIYPTSTRSIDRWFLCVIITFGG